MPGIHDLTKGQRESLLEEVLELFILFCEREFKRHLYRREFKRHLYRYQIRVARALFHSLFVIPSMST